MVALEGPARMGRRGQRDREAWAKNDDDDRTFISKRVSWILRHDARNAGVKQDPKTKWVKFSELCEAKVLKEFSPEMIWQTIVDFNGKKLRYEIKEDVDGRCIRAYTREARKALEEGAAPSGSGWASPSAAADKPEFTPAAALAPTAAAAAAASPQFPAPQFPPVQFPQAATQFPQAAQFQQAAAAAQAQQAAAYAAAQQFGYPWNFGFHPMMPFISPFMWQQQAQAAAVAGAAVKYQGRIKSFNSEKGFGFIECQQTYVQYNRDVYLHKAQIGDLTTGSFVQFACEVNKSGMPQAKDVQAIQAPIGVQAPPPPCGGKGAGGKGKFGKDGFKGGKDSGKGGYGKGGKEGGKGKQGDKGSKGKDSKDKKGDAAKETAAKSAETPAVGEVAPKEVGLVPESVPAPPAVTEAAGATAPPAEGAAAEAGPAQPAAVEVPEPSADK